MQSSKGTIWIALAAALVTSACGGGGAATGPGDGGDDGGGGTPSFAALAVSPPTGSVDVGASFQLAATPTDAAGQPVQGLPAATWQSGDPARATVSASGLVTGVAAGPVAITATLSAGGVTRTATSQLTVTALTPPAPAFASLEINPPAGSVGVGSTLQLTAIPRDAGGAGIPNLPAASWSTSDAGRAGVSSTGVVTGVAAGTATITATLTAGGVTRTGSAVVTVTTPPAGSTALVQGIGHSFSPSAVTITTGGTVTWKMVDEEHDVTWTGAAPPGGNIPKLDEGEQASRTFPTAGTYAYRCTRHENHDETGTVTVQHAPGTGGPVYTLLTIAPAAPAVAVGGTVQLTATPRDQSGAAMAGLPAASWTTLDASKATVSPTGVVTGVAAGSTLVTATLTHGGVTRTASVTVTVGGGTTTPPTGPATATVTTPGSSFSPSLVTIARGGSVTWQISGARHNVTFSGAAPTGGSIPDTENASATRTFPTAGSYDYVCTRHSGMTGRVVVQ